MSKRDDLGDAIFEALYKWVSPMSGRTVLAIVLLFYGGLGLALPLALSFPVTWLVVFNLLGTAFAAIVVLYWLAGLVQQGRRRDLLEWTTDLRRLTSEEFEWLVGEVFRREGWDVKETGSQHSSDGNIDLDLTRGKQRLVIQCKRWQSWEVGVDEIRKFGGTLMGQGLSGPNGAIVTLSEFTPQALQYAKSTRISLIDRFDLYSRMEKARRVEPCNICQEPMLLSRSEHGWWFRCVNKSGCQGKRDIGRDPGAAVDFLTQPPAV